MTGEIDDDRSRDPGRRQMALARSLPLLVFVILATAVIALLAFRNFGDLRRSAALYDQTRQVCSGLPAPGAAAYQPGPSVHPVIVFVISPTDLIQPDQSLVRQAWLPDSVDELELILCLQNARPAIRTLCDNSAISNPVGLEAQAILYEASTARIITEGVITSDPRAAADCLDELPDQIQSADRFTADGVIEWLEPFVAGEE